MNSVSCSDDQVSMHSGVYSMLGIEPQMVQNGEVISISVRVLANVATARQRRPLMY
jgi:hypothetical protein